MPTTLSQAEPQFTETLVGGSNTDELYDWLSRREYLWMLDSPYDSRLEALAGSLPVTRMWYRKLKQNGKDPFPAPESAEAIDEAFEYVDEVIRERFSDD